MLETNYIRMRSEPDATRFSMLLDHLETDGIAQLLKEHGKPNEKGNKFKVSTLEIPHPELVGITVKAYEGCHLVSFLSSFFTEKNKKRDAFLDIAAPVSARKTYLRDITGGSGNALRMDRAVSFFGYLEEFFKTSHFQILLSFYQYCYENYLPLRIFDSNRETLKDAIDEMEAYKANVFASTYGQIMGEADFRLVPKSSIGVIGRNEELEELKTFLYGEEKSAFVTGAPGVGKTEICKAAIKEFVIKADTPVFYIRVPDTADHVELMQLIGSAVNLSSDLVSKITKLDQIASRIIKGIYYFDNLENVLETTEGLQLVCDFISLNGVRLVASTRTKVQSLDCYELTLGVLDNDSAKQLFNAYWQAGTPDVELLKIFLHDELENHPLSIVLAASTSKNKKVDFGRLLELWNETGTQSLKTEQSVKRQNRTNSLTRCFDISYEMLKSETGALNTWLFCALFTGEIPETLLSQFSGFNDVSDSIKILEEYSIISGTVEGYALLSPLSQYARDKALIDTQSVFDWTQTKQHAYAFCEFAFSNDNFQRKDEAERFNNLNALKHHGFIQRLFETDVKSKGFNKDMLLRCHHKLYKVYTSNLPQLHQIFEFTYRTFNDLMSAILLANLNVFRGKLGEAESLCNDILDSPQIDKQLYGDTLSCLGDIFSKQGKYSRSFHALEESLKVNQELDSPNQCILLIKLGQQYLQQNNVEKAESYLNKSFSIAKERKLFLDSALSSLFLVQAALQKKGVAKDESLRLKTLIFIAESYFKDHHYTDYSMQTLQIKAELLANEKKQKQALEAYSEAGEYYEKTQQNEMFAITRQKIGELLIGEGMKHEGSAFLMHALGLFMEEEAYYYAGSVMISLASTQSSVDSSIECFEKSVLLFQKTEPSSPYCKLLMSLGNIYISNKNYERAKTFLLLLLSASKADYLLHFQPLALLGLCRLGFMRGDTQEIVNIAQECGKVCLEIGDDENFCKANIMLLNALRAVEQDDIAKEIMSTEVLNVASFNHFIKPKNQMYFLNYVELNVLFDCEGKFSALTDIISQMVSYGQEKLSGIFLFYITLLNQRLLFRLNSDSDKYFNDAVKDIIKFFDLSKEAMVVPEEHLMGYYYYSIYDISGKEQNLFRQRLQQLGLKPIVIPDNFEDPIATQLFFLDEAHHLQ